METTVRVRWATGDGEIFEKSCKIKFCNSRFSIIFTFDGDFQVTHEFVLVNQKSGCTFRLMLHLKQLFGKPLPVSNFDIQITSYSVMIKVKTFWESSIEIFEAPFEFLDWIGKLRK